MSLVLCAAMVALWVRSYRIQDQAGRVGEAKLSFIWSLPGSLFLSVSPADPENEEPGPRPYYFYNRGMRTTGLMAGGKVVRFSARVDTKRGLGKIVVPHWVVTLLLSALPVLWARRYQQRRRWASQGRCARCGYDLRATPEQCPECGALPEAAPAAAA